jgi:tocopherol cyclase
MLLLLLLLQVGGGPWWSPWSATADMKEPFRTLVQLPIDLGALSQVVPDPLKPPGL